MKLKTYPPCRARIGLLCPASNTMIEPDLHRIAPKDITIHTARVHFKGYTDTWKSEDITDHLKQMRDQLEEVATQLVPAKVDVMVYGLTVGSFYGGPAWDEACIRKMNKVSGVPATTAAMALREAIKTMGISKVVVASPYFRDWNERLRNYLRAFGIDVLKDSFLGVDSNHKIAAILPTEIYDLAKTTDIKEAEGLVLPCTNWRAVEVIENLETDLGKLVVTANQAALWHACRLIGLQKSIRGYGRLFRDFIST